MNTRVCVECGAPAASEAGVALCPACALRGALDTNATRGGDTDATRASDPEATRASGASERSAPNADVSSLPDPRQRFADFELLEEIGRGGMGVVHRARQLSLGRVVAVKMLLPGAVGPDDVRRFRTEASTAAALQHPNIVAVHEVGAWQGRQYLVMDFVAGRSLARHISDAKRRAGDFQQVARWCAAIADAVQHAHDLGILHRDIKPSNVLIDERNQPRVTDFGLAKRMGGETELTLSGQALGSPSYMPPEQATGGKVSGRSDVYGIGATLYHALTGRPPFRGENTTEVLNQVLTSEPVPPRTVNAAIPRDLETICLKCLEKDPSRRYGSAALVADDLRRYLEGEPITARPVGAIERLWRRARKKPLAAAVVLSLAIAALLGWRAYDSGRQLQREARRRAVDVAIDKAWGGDREAAAQAIAEAERLGVEPLTLHLLRGQVALNTVRNKEAVKEFQAAVAAAPQSVAARAALASALLSVGDYDGFAVSMAELAAATPVTDEDYLFLGYAAASRSGVVPAGAQQDTPGAVALLQEAVRRRPTGTTFGMLAVAEAFQALDESNWPAAKRAMEHANTASQLLGPEHPVVRCSEMNVSTIALRLCPEGECAAVRERAAAAADESRPGPCGFIRALYWQTIGNREAEARTMQRSAVRGSGAYASTGAAVMLGFDRSAETLGLMRPVEDSDDGFSVVGRLYLLLDAGRRDEAERLYAATADRQVASRPFAEGVLLLAGESERVAANSRRLVTALPETHPLRPVFRFWAGDLSEQAFLDRAGPSRVAQGAARFFAGMAALGRGDRERAASHFREAVATGMHWHQEYQWSRAFLLRMEKDPTWPARLQGSSAPRAVSQ